MPVTYTFANATAAIPLSQLDNNFATPITIGNVAIQLGNTVSSIGNVTLANATVSNSTLGNVTITSVASTFPNNYLSNSSVTIGNTAVALGSSASTIGNVTLTNATLSSLATPITTAEGGTGLSGSTPFTANGVVYASSTSALATGSALTFDGSKLIASGSNEAIRIANSAPYLSFYNSAQTTQYGYIQHTGTDLALVNVQNGTIPFYTNNTEQMRLTSTGLGIGTSSPVGTLTLGKVSLSNGTLRFNGATTSADFMYMTSTGAGGVLGIESSAGGQIVSGSSAYATVLYTSNSTSLQLGTNNAIKATLDTFGNLGIGTTANASAILDAQSTTKGVRFPNMTTTQKNAISSPAAGLVVFDTTLSKLCVYSGSAWQTITSV